MVTKWDNSQNGSVHNSWLSIWCCWESAVRSMFACTDARCLKFVCDVGVRDVKWWWCCQLPIPFPTSDLHEKCNLRIFAKILFRSTELGEHRPKDDEVLPRVRPIVYSFAVHAEDRRYQVGRLQEVVLGQLPVAVQAEHCHLLLELDTMVYLL